MSGKYEAGDRVVFTRDIKAFTVGCTLYAKEGEEAVILEVEGFPPKDHCLVKLDRGNILLVATDEFKAVEVSVQYPSSSKPLRINRLLAKVAKDLPSDALSKAESEGRMTGETTGYLLSFLGQVISNPNKWYTIRKNPYGERARNCEMDYLKGMVEMLQLDFIEFRHSDKSVMFRLYEDFNGKYDLYNREVKDA